METVLLIGATGNVGVSAAIAVLRSGRKVLAIVRNQDSAEKLFKHVGAREGITTVEADVTSEQGIKGVVEQVKAGKLPAFQHVFSAVGGLYRTTPLLEMTTEELRESMARNWEPNFFAYRDTMPYLLEQNDPRSSWTVCTGSSGDVGQHAGPAISQGPIFSMLQSAYLEAEHTNVRVNELYLGVRVEVDESAEKTGAQKSSDFAAAYEKILANDQWKACRVIVMKPKHFTEPEIEVRIRRVAMIPESEF